MAVVAPNPNPFALAITSFISDIKRKENVRSPFYKEVLAHLNTNNDLLGKDQSNESADHLNAFIRELERKQKRDSKTLWITDKLRPLVSGLAQYTSVCDVMIQGAPFPGVILYGGARLVLQLAQNFFNCFDTVLSIMEDIGHLLQCYHLFSSAYASSFDIQNLLVESYKNIVSFWHKASKLLSRPAYKTLLVGIVKPLDAEWQKCRQGLVADSSRVQMLAHATEADLRRQKDLEKADHRQSKMRKDIVDWIKAGEDDAKLDIRGDIRENMERRYDNTCEWLFEHPDMEKWLAAKKSTALWYSAPPGAGKTILASAVALHLQDKGLKTATFFYSFNDVVRRKPITALRCLALQLLKHSDPIPDKVRRLYEEDIMNHCFKLVYFQVAIEVIEALIKQIGRIHIIVDGLDECPDRQQLFNSICPLLKTKTYGIVKWFFASRREHDIRSSMRKHGVTEIEAPRDRLVSDIRRYVTNHLQEKLGSNCEKCIEHWTSESEGNFLWVTHMLRIVGGEDLTCEEEIEEELNRFPKGLTGCYIRSLAQLSKRPERHQQLARRIFTMIVGAVQPLHLSELSHALATVPGSTDYSSKGVPRLNLIQELCSNLVVFDDRSKGSESDPLLKIAHKSIQDFFLQDPDSLEIPDDLRQYFVSVSATNLELGQSCLAYLGYRRYHQPQDVSTILENKDHAFLRHAATFWHQYLNLARHSEELSEKVKDFVQSPAFWTCVAVQSRIAPHLFARYRLISGGSYRPEGTGPTNQGQGEENVSYAVPLPQWLDDYAPEIVETFHSFVKEWHPVLTSYPSALDKCAMDRRWESNVPGRAPWRSSRVRFSSLSFDESWSSNFSNLAVMDVKAHSDDIMVALFGNQVVCDGSHPQWVHLLIDSESVSSYLESRATMPVIAEFSGETRIFSPTYTWGGPYSLIDPSCLRVQQYAIKNEGAKDALARISDTWPRESVAGKWRLVCNATYGSYDGSSSSQRAVAFHCSLHVTCEDNASSRHDSGFGSRRPSIHDDDDSDSDISNSGSESEAPSEKGLTTRNCMLIVQDGGSPIWHFWQSIDAPLEARCAFHPIEPLAVWSPSTHELCIKHLRSGKVQSTVLPEPADIRFSSVSATRKEFHFSASGDSLYYLLYTATENEAGIQQTVSVLSFHFSSDDDGDCVLRRISPTQTIRYECTGPIQHPLILTSWTAEEHLYIALPPLSCNPKILRVQLLPNDEYNSGKLGSAGFQTLREPVYFPSSTPSRNPQMTVFHRKEGKETMTLALDAENSVISSHLGANATELDTRQPPALMSWDLDQKQDWRDWDSSVDERPEELQAGQSTYEMLRGTFVDADRRFNVSVRAGLDWRKKAFLSCA
jgi:hypothetical protein